MNSDLIKKYNVAAPRYTSYPTVPYWDTIPPTKEQWKLSVKRSFKETNEKDGISLYIHLPFCESLCTFCGCNTRITVNHGVEMPYIDAVLKEWSLYLDFLGEVPHIREIHLGGGTPTFFSPEHLRTLIQGITKRAIICKDAEFGFEAHPGNTTDAHLKTLYELGFRRLSLGIQDFDEKVQDVINRHQTYEQVKAVVDSARELGYTSINFDLVYGLPMQTQQSIVHTLEKVNLLMPDRIAYYSYAHVPWLKPGQRKFTEADLPVDYEKRQLYELGCNLFKKAGYHDIGMDHFSLKTDTLYKAEMNGTLHRNFMGYAHNYTQLMIGLGVSSISDSWYGYAQNIKTVEEYQQTVNKGELPIFKGHLLNEEDLILRRHILNIICNYRTSWQKQEEQCEALHESILRLTELEKDQLILLHPFSLEVTEKGKSFLRNICMAFDARLWRSAPKLQIFSTVA